MEAAGDLGDPVFLYLRRVCKHAQVMKVRLLLDTGAANCTGDTEAKQSLFR